MKNLLLVFIFIFSHNQVVSQDLLKKDLPASKIYIVGVIHSKNKLRNTDSLYKILTKIKPDLILSEDDTLSGFFKKDYTFRPLTWKTKLLQRLHIIEQNSPEISVLSEYKHHNNSVSICPFDMYIPNKRQYISNYYKNEKEWVGILNSAFANNEIPTKLMPLQYDFAKYSNWLYNFSELGYFEMNQKIVGDSIRKMMAFEEIYFPKVIDSVKRLNRFKGYKAENSSFWKLRNETMAKNILRFIEMKKAKRIVIFTGLLHKYYLIDLLTKRKTESNIELVEYYEE